MKISRMFLPVTLLVTTIATVVWAQGRLSLWMNGNVALTSVMMIGGHPYVPLADVARSQNMIVKQRAGGYEITAAGGAQQVSGKLRGKIGDVLFDGHWQFQVIRVERAGTYPSKYAQDAYTYNPSGSNDELVVVTCHIKNSRQQTWTPILSHRHCKNTALTDDQGQSYPPIGVDMRGSDNDCGVAMLPGAQATFAELFSVPKGTVVKDLVFSMQSFPTDFPDGGTDPADIVSAVATQGNSNVAKSNGWTGFTG